MRPLLLMQLLCLILAATAGGCDSRPSVPSNARKIDIAATVLPLADIAQKIGGEYVETSWIVESGQSLDGIHLDSARRSRLANADFVITGGATEPWATDGFDDPLRGQRVIRLDLLDAARQTPNLGLLWLDPLIVKDCAREVTARLTIRRPEWEPYFRQHRDQFLADVDKLMNQYDAKLRAAPVRSLMVLSSDYDALLYRFGFEPVHAVTASVTQIGDSEMRILRYRAEQKRTRLLIVPADTPSVVQQDLTLRGTLQIVPLDPLGSSSGSGRKTYVDLMRYNLDQLLRATSVQ